MFDFPKVEHCTHFPLPEGTNLEFKVGFNSSMTDKIYATICGILNSGGGYLVIGVEDDTRFIRGIKTDKSMDHFLIALDNIYHHGHIRLRDGNVIPLGTVISGTVQAAEGKELLVVTCTPADGQQYIVKDGSVWYRLAASNFKKTNLPVFYTEKDMEGMITAQTRALHVKINQLQHEKEEMRVRFRSLENDFERVLRAAKQTEQKFIGFRDMLFTNIQLQKSEAEKELETEKASWFSYLFGCCS
jgi:predicted HTH transcriptional regulator